MKQLIVVSTQMEVQIFTGKAGLSKSLSPGEAVRIRDDLSLLISGIGSPSTIFHLTSALKEDTFDRIIQVGVAGSYNPVYGPGTLVEAGRDCFADLGIDDNGKFINVFDAGLADSDMAPFIKGLLVNPLTGISGLPVVSGITLNTTTGSSALMEQWEKNYQPDIESMEGAAAFYVCMKLGIPFIQVRSISNKVEPRDRDAWDLELAIHELNKWLVNFVNLEKQE